MDGLSPMVTRAEATTHHHTTKLYYAIYDSLHPFGSSNYSVLLYSILFYSMLFIRFIQLFYCILFYSTLFHSVHSTILFYCILFYFVQFYSTSCYSILFYSILCYSILFYSILFYSILFYAMLEGGSLVTRPLIVSRRDRYGSHINTTRTLVLACTPLLQPLHHSMCWLHLLVVMT
jgi:hypothetical protein